VGPFLFYTNDTFLDSLCVTKCYYEIHIIFFHDGKSSFWPISYLFWYGNCLYGVQELFRNNNSKGEKNETNIKKHD
jgi:hypothetical protein